MKGFKLVVAILFGTIILGSSSFAAAQGYVPGGWHYGDPGVDKEFMDQEEWTPGEMVVGAVVFLGALGIAWRPPRRRKTRGLGEPE